MAPFIDGGRTVDRTNWSNTIISYYPFGGAIALALDLDAARPQRRPRVARRLHAGDVAQVRQAGRQPRRLRRSSLHHRATPRRRWPRSAATRAFARDFFARYIQGHDVADYARLLARAGFTVRRRNAGTRVARRSPARVARRLRVAALVAPTWPIYASGLDQDDELQQIDGQRISSESDVASALRAAQAGRHRSGRVRRSHRSGEDRAR